MATLRFPKYCLLLALLVILFSACATNKRLTVGATASLLEDISKSANRQSDLRLIREGMPAYLMLIDGMVEAVPDNERLLISAAQGYASFASAFIQDEDKDYARVLYAKAKDYGLRALQQIGFKNPVSSPFDEFEKGLQQLGSDDVPYMFWSASCWGNWINLNMGSMEALAELPRVESMMKRVLELDEAYYYGGPHIFMGIWFASRPKVAGGDLDRARSHFQKAIELGEGQFLMTYVYYANYYAKKAFDKELFLTTLEKALRTPADIVPDLTLLNTVAHTKAKALQEEANEYF
ncbi:MAG: TRAP transporter TatT component family protein [Desulfobacterales bacterium]|jgi:tetratricopeptide (TPR) repeat protein